MTRCLSLLFRIPGQLLLRVANALDGDPSVCGEVCKTLYHGGMRLKVTKVPRVTGPMGYGVFLDFFAENLGGWIPVGDFADWNINTAAYLLSHASDFVSAMQAHEDALVVD